jgi:hypothetical protein
MMDTKPATTNGRVPTMSQARVETISPDLTMLAPSVGGQVQPIAAKRLARIAGVLYLILAIFGGFAEGVVYPKIYVASDAAATARNLVQNSGLVRIGVVADLFQATVWVFLALTLYRLLKPVNKSMASVVVVLVSLGAGITMFNTVFEYEGLRVATGAVNLGGLGATSASALALVFVETQHYGLLIGQIFFGLWLVPLGYLAFKSGWFPKALGVALIVGGACYLLDVLAAFLVPDLGKVVHGYITVPSAIAELWMVGYLLVIGVRTPRSDKPVGSR